MVNTVTKIKKHAQTLFVEKGYEATSLADIGEKVGIKKQSIYSHFKNKDDLFLQIMQEVVQEEISFLDRYFTESRNEPLEDILFNFIVQIEQRFTSNKENNIKFLLRFMFTSPPHLHDTAVATSLTYYREIEKHVERTMHRYEEQLAVSANKAQIAYLAFFDGLLVELIYIGVRDFEKRFQVSWEIYWKGVKK